MTWACWRFQSRRVHMRTKVSILCNRSQLGTLGRCNPEQVVWGPLKNHVPSCGQGMQGHLFLHGVPLVGACAKSCFWYPWPPPEQCFLHRSLLRRCPPQVTKIPSTPSALSAKSATPSWCRSRTLPPPPRWIQCHKWPRSFCNLTVGFVKHSPFPVLIQGSGCVNLT